MKRQYKKLSEFCEYSDKRIDISEVDEHNYISTENMLPDKSGVTVASSIPSVKTLSRYELNNILISNIRPYFKKIWFPNKIGGCSNDVLVLNVFDNIFPQFLYYALCDSNFFNYATVTSKGTKMPRGSKNAIMKYLVPDIDEKTQKKIANILSAYDDLIENNNKRIELLENMAQELYKEWFVRFRFPGHKTAKFINGIPEGWMVDKIKNRVNRLSFNRLYKEYELNNEGNVIVIDQSEKDYLGFHNNEPSHIANYEAPICLFGDHSCKFKLMTIPFSLGENVVPFKGLDIDTYYLYFSVHKIIKTEEYKRHWGVFTSKKILIPTEDLQNNFAQIVQPIQQQIDIIYKSQILLKRQRDLLLPRLMSGKLEVKVS